jgi:hypothetical protein
MLPKMSRSGASYNSQFSSMLVMGLEKDSAVSSYPAVLCSPRPSGSEGCARMPPFLYYVARVRKNGSEGTN